MQGAIFTLKVSPASRIGCRVLGEADVGTGGTDARKSSERPQNGRQTTGNPRYWEQRDAVTGLTVLSTRNHLDCTFSSPTVAVLCNNFHIKDRVVANLIQ